MKLLILIIFLFNCLNVKNFKNDSLQENLLASLLGEKNISLNTVANRRVTGQLININNEIMKNVEIKNLKINKKNLITKETKTTEEGYFSIETITGITNIDLIKDNTKIGEITLNIEENNITYTSDSFKINNLKSVYIYSSGYETPLILVNYFLGYSSDYYLNIEFANVSDTEMTFVSSEINVKTKGFKIYYPYFNSDTSQNSVSKKFLGSRMKAGEYRSIYNYMENFWKYENKQYDSENYLRYYAPTNLDLFLLQDAMKTKYFQVIVDNTISKGSVISLEITFTQSNGIVSTIPFQIIF